MQDHKWSTLEVMTGIVCVSPFAMTALTIAAWAVSIVTRITPGPMDTDALAAAILLTPATALCWIGRAVSCAKQARIDQLAAELAAERSTRH